MIERVRTRLESLLVRRGSTRPVALVRIGLAFLLMDRYSQAMGLYKWDGSPEEVIASLAFYTLLPCMMLGLFTRIVMPLMAVLMTAGALYFGATLHHKPGFGAIGPWLVTCLLALTPCGESFSLDRWRAVRRARAQNQPIPAEEGDLWAVPLLWLQVSVMYLFAAADKTDAQWLAGERIERIYMNYYGSSETLVLEPLVHSISVVVAYATTALELSLAIGLWIRPLRRYLIPLGLALHASFWVFLALWPLSGRMWLMYILFCDPRRVHEFFDTVMGRPPTDGGGEPTPAPA